LEAGPDLGRRIYCLLVAGLAAVERGCLGEGCSFIYLHKQSNRPEVFVSIIVTGGVLVAAPLGPRVAGCLGGISVGRDWALFLEGVAYRSGGAGVWRHRWWLCGGLEFG
jgi:hypothetical protein